MISEACGLAISRYREVAKHFATKECSTKAKILGFCTESASYGGDGNGGRMGREEISGFERVIHLALDNSMIFLEVMNKRKYA